MADPASQPHASHPHSSHPHEQCVDWATHVLIRIEQLEDHLYELPPPQKLTPPYALACKNVEEARIYALLPQIPAELLPGPEQRLRAHAKRPSKKKRHRFQDWWNGDRTERAYSALHRADAEYIEVAPLGSLSEIALELKARLHDAAFPPDDPRLNTFKDDLDRIVSSPIVSGSPPGLPQIPLAAVQAASPPDARGEEPAKRQLIEPDVRIRLRSIREAINLQLTITAYGIRRLRNPDRSLSR